MEIEERVQGSQPILTGGNAQELMMGAACRNRRDDGVQPRPPPRGDPNPTGRPRPDPGPIDPLAQGFDRIMARFDQLEVRMDNSDRRVDGLENLPGDDYDSEEREYAEYRETDLVQRDPIPRQRHLGFRDRRLMRGGHRDGLFRRDDSRRGGDWQQDSSYDTRMVPYQPRRTSSWDPPGVRQRGWRDQRRRPSCWDPPASRDRSQYPYGSDSNQGVKMRAPHFDGSDATNWISRVEYYFDHIMLPDEDRLHYVVMLFDPPAAEWIFNYRNNNRHITWAESIGSTHRA